MGGLERLLTGRASAAAPVRYLDATAIRGLLSFGLAADAARRGFLALADGSVAAPEPRESRLAFEALGPLVGRGFRLRTKPVVAGNYLGIRLIAGAADGSAYPSWRWTIVRPVDGRGPTTIVDESETYLLRTAASAAVAAQALGPRRPWRLGLLGAGRISRLIPGVLDALAVPLAECWIASRTRSSAERLVGELSELEPAGHWAVAPDADGLLARCDVVIAATTANAPLLRLAAVRPGSLICAIGEARELEDDLVLAARPLVVDDWPICAAGADLAPLVAAGALTEERTLALPEILAGRRSCPAGERPEPVVYRSRGAATLDLTLAVALAEKLDAKEATQ